MELYKKKGRKYIKVDRFEDTGLPEGLYLFYKPDYKGEGHNAMMNMLHYAKVHQIENVGKFCDIWVKHEEVLTKEISKGIDDWIKEKKSYSIHDLSMMVCKTLSNIKE